MDEKVLNQYGRTRLYSTQEYTEFDFSGQGERVYDTFADCYQDILDGNTPRVQPEVEEFEDKWKDESLSMAITFADYFEDLYQCSGICESPLFFYSLPLSEGKPD